MKAILSLPSSTMMSAKNPSGAKETYRIVEVVLLRALLLVPLDNTEFGLILRILHDVPVKCLISAAPELETAHLLVLSVDTSSFDQFCLELLDCVLNLSYPT